MIHRTRHHAIAMASALVPAVIGAASAVDPLVPPWRFVDATAPVGLDGRSAPRLAVADLDGDDRPDLVLDRTSVLLNEASADPPGFRFRQVDSRLEHPGADGVTIFVDLDGDAIPDAVAVRSRAAATWQRGVGDGTFGAAVPIDAARSGTIAAIAAGDADRDGRTDLLLARWYRAYGERLDADPADLLLQRRDGEGAVRFVRQSLPEDEVEFDEERDAGGRPLYGALIATLLDPSEAPPPQLIELAYGRRWNRLYARLEQGWIDLAPALGLDGDAERSGRYPAWLRERAATDPRFDRTDEKPFRSNGNTFDGAVGDIDGDGRFDLVVAEITHAWAGPSSDRTRVLLRRGARFESPPEWSLDRIPSEDSAEARRWNQGDLFVELADLDLDGDLDLVLASGDYPDPPPGDERLRVFLQQPSAPRWTDATSALGVDHPGCAQISLADFDLDGRIDLVAAQSFTRFTPAMIEAAGGTPRVRLFLNRPAERAEPARSIELILRGDPALGVAAIPIGAVVEIEPVGDDAPANGASAAAPAAPARMIRQLAGPGGHSGKQSEAIVHAGLGAASKARVRVTWPSNPPLVSPWQVLPAGRHRLTPSK